MVDREGFEGSLTYSPWADIGERYPDWVVRFDDLRGLPELMCWDAQVILLEGARTVPERRSDLAHAIGHLDLEHRGDTFNRKHEESASRYAAKLLIDLDVLAEAMLWSNDYREVAELLRVDIPTVKKRLEHLHPVERSYLNRALADSA